MHFLTWSELGIEPRTPCASAHTTNVPEMAAPWYYYSNHKTNSLTSHMCREVKNALFSLHRINFFLFWVLKNSIERRHQSLGFHLPFLQVFLQGMRELVERDISKQHPLKISGSANWSAYPVSSVMELYLPKRANSATWLHTKGSGNTIDSVWLVKAKATSGLYPMIDSFLAGIAIDFINVVPQLFYCDVL